MNAIALIAALTLGQLWGPQPPAWGTPGAGSSPACNPPSSAARIDARAFYDSIGGDRLAAAVVRVRVSDRNGQNSLGSGTLVEAYDDGSGLVVTNNHVVRDAASATAGEVVFRSGERARFAIREADPVWDIAVLEVAAPQSVEPVQLADAPPGRGEPLMIAGYGAPSQGLLFQAGQFVKRGAPRIGYPLEQLALQPCQARSGDSGGPVFDGRGRMVACLWGASPGETIASPCTRIAALLRNVRQRLGRRLRGEVPGQTLPQRPLAPILPGPIAQAPSQSPGQSPNQQPNPSLPPLSPLSPPAVPAPPALIPSGPNAGGELATILERIKGLEGKLAERAKEAAPSIVDEGKQLAEGAIEAAAPSLLESLASKLMPLALTALGGLTGIGLPIGGVAAGSWLIGKAGKFIVRRIAKNRGVKTAADQQGLASGTTPSGAGMPQSLISAADLTALAEKLRGEMLAAIDQKTATTGGATAPPSAAFPIVEDRATEYGKQLVQASGLTGVDPVVAATRGIVFSDEVDNLIAAGDQVAARVVNDLRKRVDERVSQIHPLAVKSGV